MRMSEIPFSTVDWSTVETTEHLGELVDGVRGMALWRTRNFGPPDNLVRVRMVEYTPGYVADHWCQKGHVLLCLEGQLDTELADGRCFTLTAGMSYQVADGAEAHRSSTALGARLFIVD